MTSPITPNPGVHNNPKANVPAPITSGAQTGALGTALFDSFLAELLNAFAGTGTGPFAQLLHTFANDLQTDSTNALLGTATNTNSINSLNAAIQKSWLNLQSVINGVVGTVDADAEAFVAALETIGGNAAASFAAWDALFVDLGFSVSTAADLATFLSGQITTNTTAITNRAVTKPSYFSLDPTADSVFPLASITSSSATTISAAAGTSVIGYIGTPDAGLKQTIIWQAPAVASGLSLIFNVYSLNTVTGLLTNILTSSTITAAGAGANYFNIPTASQITSAQGNWYAVELVNTSSTAYSLVGLPNHWLTANTANSGVYPQSMGGMRASVAPPVFDAEGASSRGTGASPRTQTESHTAALGADVLVFAAAFSGATISALTASYNGVSMGSPVITENPNTTASDGVFALFRAAGAGTGSAATVSVTATSTATVFLTFNSVSYPNVSSLGGVTDAAGSSATPSISNSGNIGDVVIVAFASVSSVGSATITGLTGATSRSSQISGGTDFPAVVIGDAGGTGSSTTFSATATNTAWAAISVVLHGTASNSPATVTAANAPYSSNVPFFALGGVAGTPFHEPVQATFTTAGSFTYNIPTWAQTEGTLFDIIVLGAGAGGSPGSTIFAYGAGGFGGNFTVVTLTYGVQFPLGTTTFTGTIGAGGAFGVPEVSNGLPGGSSSVSITGYSGSPITATGGASGFGINPTYFGSSPGNEVVTSGLGTVTYDGGGTQTVAGQPGDAPGGGGAGGSYFAAGAAGAPGQVWITAYQ